MEISLQPLKWLGEENRKLREQLAALELANSKGQPVDADLLQEHDLLQALMEKVPDGIYFKDKQSRFLRINQALADRFGLSDSSEAIGKTNRDFFTEEFARKTRADEWEVLQTGRPVFDMEEKESWLDGRQTWVSTSLLPLPDRAGRIVGTFGISHDITQRKQLEVQVRQAQKMEAIGRLAGGVAHDFNNFLTIIAGCTELLLDHTAHENPGRSLILEIRQAGERAAALTRQLLAFSRKQILQPEVLDINSIVADMEKMLRRLIGERINLVTDLDPELGQIRADPGQIEQVVMNLVVNARDALAGDGTILIHTRNLDLDAPHRNGNGEIAAGRYLRLTVTDTGCGMDPDTKSHLFEPFFTTKEVGKGTGLGLATVFGIVKQSSGHIKVESAPGEGTTVQILFPRTAAVMPLRKSSPGLAQAPTGQETVLVVEDDDHVRSLVSLVLSTSGYTVLEARDGHDALLCSAQYLGPIQLLVADVVMPRIGGRELVDSLRPVRPEMKVLFLTGYTDGLTKDIALLLKPFTPLTLARKVREVLEAPGLLDSWPGDPARWSGIPQGAFRNGVNNLPHEIYEQP